MSLRRAIAVLVLLAATAACSGNDGSDPEPAAATSSTTTETFAVGEAPSSTSTTSADEGGETTTTTAAPTTQRGVKFVARPDFSTAPPGVCAVRPCFQPIFDRPGGRRVTDGWPCEYYDQASYSPEAPYCADKTTPEGDRLQIACQFQDIDVEGSSWWDRVVIPEERLVSGHGLTPVDGVYYGVAPDRWLGNHGDRGIPCQ